jgi:hypothetical protein
MANNGIQKAPPPDFRELTNEEKLVMETVSAKSMFMNEKLKRIEQQIRAAEAEIKAAKLEREKAVAAGNQLNREIAEFEAKLGIVDKVKDHLTLDGKFFVRAQEKKAAQRPRIAE